MYSANFKQLQEATALEHAIIGNKSLTNGEKVVALAHLIGSRSRTTSIMAHGTVAAMLGMSRSQVQRIMRSLRNKGIFDTYRTEYVTHVDPGGSALPERRHRDTTLTIQYNDLLPKGVSIENLSNGKALLPKKKIRLSAPRNPQSGERIVRDKFLRNHKKVLASAPSQAALKALSFASLGGAAESLLLTGSNTLVPLIPSSSFLPSSSNLRHTYLADRYDRQAQTPKIFDQETLAEGRIPEMKKAPRPHVRPGSEAIQRSHGEVVGGADVVARDEQIKREHPAPPLNTEDFRAHNGDSKAEVRVALAQELVKKEKERAAELHATLQAKRGGRRTGKWAGWTLAAIDGHKYTAPSSKTLLNFYREKMKEVFNIDISPECSVKEMAMMKRVLTWYPYERVTRMMEYVMAHWDRIAGDYRMNAPAPKINMFASKALVDAWIVETEISKKREEIAKAPDPREVWYAAMVVEFGPPPGGKPFKEFTPHGGLFESAFHGRTDELTPGELAYYEKIMSRKETWRVNYRNSGNDLTDKLISDFAKWIKHRKDKNEYN